MLATLELLLGFSSDDLGRSWAAVGRSCGGLGSVFGQDFGRFLGSNEKTFRIETYHTKSKSSKISGRNAFWEVLGLGVVFIGLGWSWCGLEAVLGGQEAVLGGLGVLLAALEAVFRRSWTVLVVDDQEATRSGNPVGPGPVDTRRAIGSSLLTWSLDDVKCT